MRYLGTLLYQNRGWLCPPPIPAGRLEIPFLLKFLCYKQTNFEKMKTFVQTLYDYSFVRAVTEDNSNKEEEIEIGIVSGSHPHGDRHLVGYSDIMEQLPRKTIPAGNYMFKVSNRNTRKRCEICSKLTIKYQNDANGVIFYNTYFTHFSSISIVNFEQVYAGWIVTKTMKWKLQ